MIRKLRVKLIEFLACGEPVLIGWCINGVLVPKGLHAVYIPPENTTMPVNEIRKKGILTPINVGKPVLMRGR